MPAFLPRWPLSGFARANPRIFDVQMSGLGQEASSHEKTRQREDGGRERSGTTSSPTEGWSTGMQIEEPHIGTSVEIG